MAKIREDLEGVVLAIGDAGETIILRAGAKVPKGLKVGAHVLAPKVDGDDSVDEDDDRGGQNPPAGGATGSADPSEPTLPPRGGPGSGAGAWREYAAAAAEKKGLEIEIPADATRDDIIKALKGADIPVE